MMPDEGQLISLIYVSHCTIARARHDAEVEDIVSGPIVRNRGLAVRGALIFTEGHFAQLLEGPEAAVDALMASIEADPRHRQVTIIERKPIGGYRFRDWGLAYWGNAAYMDRKLASILDERRACILTHETAQIFDLIRLLAEASNDDGKPIGLRSPA